MRFATILAVLLLALPAMSQDLHRTSDCSGGFTGVCITIDETETSNTTFSLSSGGTYDCSFDPDVNTEGTATAEVKLYGMCTPAIPNTSGSTPTTGQTVTVENCALMALEVTGDSVLDDGVMNGDNGVSSNEQRRTIFGLGAGVYLLTVTTAPGSSEDAAFSCVKR